MFRFLAISCMVMATACVVPYALPPLKIEAGGATLSGAKPRFHAGGGAHLASGRLDPAQSFDVGAGGFVESSEDGLATSAAYADAAVFLDKTRNTRTSLGVRGELRWTAPLEGPRERHVGAKLRVEREYFTPAHAGYSGSDRCASVGGFAHGSGGIGLFAEAGTVLLPDRGAEDPRVAFTATAGMTLRLPSTVGVVVGFPGCR